jgi:8-oxo-dGTP pyrophosphatase MutT (NUDIX family)
MPLDHDRNPPFEVVGTRELASAGDLALRCDRLRWPDGAEINYGVLEAPHSVFTVPVHEDMTTVLVRQWRHSWAGTSWEVPAGRLAPNERPLDGARRELTEEAGLAADEWVPLGVTHGTAATGARQHLYLARRLRRVPRAPEATERDMILREIPLAEAVDAALRGEIAHSGSIAALLRAARAVGLV